MAPVGRLLVLITRGAAREFMEKAVAKASESGRGIIAAYIVDGSAGDSVASDWISSAHSREEFLEYMKAEARREGESVLESFSALARDEGIPFKSVLIEGGAEEEIKNIIRGGGMEEVMATEGVPVIKG